MCVWCVENQGRSEVIQWSKSELLPETSQTQIRFDFKLIVGPCVVRALYCFKLLVAHTLSCTTLCEVLTHSLRIRGPTTWLSG